MNEVVYDKGLKRCMVISVAIAVFQLGLAELPTN